MTDKSLLPLPVFIHACSSHSALGHTVSRIHQSISAGKSPGMTPDTGYINGDVPTVVGKALGPLPDIPAGLPNKNTRNNRLALSALLPMADDIVNAREKYGAGRVAVVLGSSTSGISDGEHALRNRLDDGSFSDNYHYTRQELANLTDFVAEYFSLQGLSYAVSTACSSSGRVFLTAKRLLRSGLADAVLVGGADSLCHLTLNGFHGLDAVSDTPCQPFSELRDGINIGEAGAFMLLSLDKPEQGPVVALLGAGDSSDAHHISAPEPEGRGAEMSMRNALADAGLSSGDVGYINAHGTATPLNDAMEAKAIGKVFGDKVPVSSTKFLTGHALGAASAIEANICWHLLAHGLELPAQREAGHDTPLVPGIRHAVKGDTLDKPVLLSNSFAFGGNNVSLIFGRL